MTLTADIIVLIFVLVILILASLFSALVAFYWWIKKEKNVALFVFGGIVALGTVLIPNVRASILNWLLAKYGFSPLPANTTWQDITVFLAVCIAGVLIVKIYYPNRNKQETITAPTQNEKEKLKSDLRDLLLERYKERHVKKLKNRISVRLRLEGISAKIGTDSSRELEWLKQRLDKKEKIEADSLVEIFLNKDYQHRITLMGEPGAGKSVQLLELALHLLQMDEPSRNNAIPDIGERLPVIINLSTWGNNPNLKTIEDWMLYNMSDIGPTQTISKLLLGGLILPLFDGFDEVAFKYRASCNAALKTFSENPNQYGAFFVICSRIKEANIDAPGDAHFVICDLDPEETLQETLKSTYGSQVVHKDCINRILNHLEDDNFKAALKTPFLLNCTMAINYTAGAFPKGEVDKIKDQIVEDFIHHCLDFKVPLTEQALPNYEHKKKLESRFSNKKKNVHWLGYLAAPTILRLNDWFDISMFNGIRSVFIKPKKATLFFVILIFAILLSMLIFGVIITLDFLLKTPYPTISSFICLSVITIGLLYTSFIFHEEKRITAIGLFSLRDKIETSGNSYEKLLGLLINQIDKKEFGAVVILIIINSATIIAGVAHLTNTIALAILIFFVNFIDLPIKRLSFLIEGRFPLRFVDFMTYCEQIGLIESNGGQWRFHHKLIQDWFERVER